MTICVIICQAFIFGFSIFLKKRVLALTLVTHFLSFQKKMCDTNSDVEQTD